MKTSLVVLAVVMLGACTLVCIRGDGNTINDTGGHGQVLPVQSHPLQDMLKKKEAH